MSLISRLFGRRTEQRSDLSVFNALEGRGSVYYGSAGRSAPHEAEQLATVVACVSAISSGLASLPARVYRTEQDGRREVSDHWLARLVRNPGPHNTWFFNDGLLDQPDGAMGQRAARSAARRPRRADRAAARPVG